MFYFTCDHCKQNTIVTPLQWFKRLTRRTNYYDSTNCFTNGLDTLTNHSDRPS